MRESDLLRELHEVYVWKVNAAVEEGRMDLVRNLADEYTDEALRLMISLESSTYLRPDCAVRAAGGSRPIASPRRRRWWWTRSR